MKNKDVINCFLNNKTGNSLNLRSTKDKLFSYDTCIVERVGDKRFIVNITKYSNTSTMHLSLFKRRLGNCYNLYVIKELDAIPKNSKSLC